MACNLGDVVEVCSKEYGFVGSYYKATVVSQSQISNNYEVEYENLVEEDLSTPLREIVSADELRPMPPELPLVSAFDVEDKVDAFDNDGWWVGKITGNEGSNYKVYFYTTREEIAYPLSRLRVHQGWIDGKWWIPSKKRLF